MDDEQRISRLENDVQDLKIRVSVAENNIAEIKADLHTIKSNTTWIMRLIIGAFILAIATFITEGGLGKL